MKKVSQRILAIGLLAALSLVIILLAVNLPQAAHRPTGTYRSCTNLPDGEQPFDCWFARYNDMVEKESTEVAIIDLGSMAATSEYAKANCHQLTHVIGHAGYKKYKDLAKAFDHGDSYCASGYYHGVMEEVSEQLGRDKVLAQITTICSTFRVKKAQGIEHHDCTHGMGHGLMSINENELFTSLEDCDLLDGQWEENSCYGGVFMENIVDEINNVTHIEKKFLRTEEPLYPCTEVADKYKPECYTYQTSHALYVLKGDYAAVFALCATVASPLDEICYQSLGRDISANTSLNQEDTIGLCTLGTTQTAREHCIIGAARDFMYITQNKQRGIVLCDAIPRAEGKALCIKIINDYYKLF